MTGPNPETRHKPPGGDSGEGWPVLALHDSSLLRSSAFVGGEWVEASTGATFSVHDPASGCELARVPNMGRADTEHAIDAAAQALDGWRNRPARERAAVLRAWHDLVLATSDDLASLMTAEQGKPLAEARSEIAYAASFLEWFAEEAKRAYGDTIPSPDRDSRILVLKQPVGVTAGITPWNFPAAMVTRKAAPALAAGCTMVLKPAEQTPLIALALAALAERAGLPRGVLNVVTADAAAAAAIGSALTESAIVRKIGFTGSRAVGALLMGQCAPLVKRISLELGGSSPFIVFDDADLERAVEGALASKFRNCGQACNATNRFLVHSALAKPFLERFAQALEHLTVGPGLREGTDVGPLVDTAALAKVEDHVADALASGATLVAGGHPHPLGGTFYEPTVLCDVTPLMRLWDEETFGPVAAVYTFDCEDEAVELANATSSGLAAYFYTRDVARVIRVSERLEFGMVGINTGIISTEVAPFGGIKMSGAGREGSRYGLDEWLELKYLRLAGVGGAPHDA